MASSLENPNRNYIILIHVPMMRVGGRPKLSILFGEIDTRLKEPISDARTSVVISRQVTQGKKHVDIQELSIQKT